jgi:hypothetical protein
MTERDAMGKAANNAAMMASKFDFYLLAASSPDLDRERRSASLEKAFANWPKICRAMAELERIAPNAAAKGAEQDARIQDFMDRRDGERGAA